MPGFSIRYARIWTVVATLLVQMDAIATSVEPGSWQELIAASDFVGVVECTGAGIYSSRFRVVEAWRGQPGMEEFTIHCTARVGERYVGALQRVLFQKIEIPVRQPGTGDPTGKTWFPEPDAGYRYHLAWGWVRVPEIYSDSLRHAFPGFGGNLDDLRQAVDSLPHTNRQYALPLVGVTPEPLAPGERESLQARLRESRSVAEAEAFSGWLHAIQRLSYTDSLFVARQLSRVKSSELGFRWPSELAGAAKVMLWGCPVAKRNRVALELMDAREPLVCLVGGAHALVEENRKARRTLAEIARGDGDVAEWANFILASYNDRARVPRAITAISFVGHRHDPNTGPVSYSDCVETMLSNSAAASGISQPGRPGDAIDPRFPKFVEKLRAHLSDWWQQHGNNIELLPIGTFPPKNLAFP
ncbi:MAG: hypothetical protein SGI88_21380 [Candidatus Hydrogenedentes bacterium]|nr:hypothetical protein [Candidatus Hydrogenedentota bacterium]